jgi:hypothetical protein
MNPVRPQKWKRKRLSVKMREGRQEIFDRKSRKADVLQVEQKMEATAQ